MNDDRLLVSYAEVRAVTEKAVLLFGEDARGYDAEDWWPLSCCPDLEDAERGDGPGEFEAPEWLVREKGWAGVR